ncbi:hypothetical protein SAMN04487910_1231 [Aquimarina amphilecti]|uniref:Uncharacterized protein n=1 Tax=Aquimarina amphilecti TaxID=1038014 RepID=A0A1H7KA54_AQUAM|nr:hypothetical protein [Aquimarina amphilecti]SEK82795.1 hypothetical protein SAMN04487910_1231 [Aquimarina amphilecti]
MLRRKEYIELYKSFEIKFVSPYGDTREFIKVQLYKQIVSSRISENIKRKPLIVFYFASNGIDIPKEDWTYEMKESAREYSLDYPVPGAGKRYSNFGNTIRFLTSIITILTCTIIFYLYNQKTIQLKSDLDEFTSFPKTGDKYYGSMTQPISNSDIPEKSYGWIKIIYVNPNDSIVSYRTSFDLGAVSFNTLETDYTNFEFIIFEGKFKVTGDREIKIISPSKKMRFKSQVIDDNIRNYKISAN